MAALVTTTWTGYSPTLSDAGASLPGLTGRLANGESFVDRKLAQLLRRQQYRPVRRLLRTLTGNAVGAGGNAVENRTRVRAQQEFADPTALGGVVPIETVPLLGATVAGRVTAAADQTRILAMIDALSALAPASYPLDLSGNGGGNRLGR